MALTDKLSAIGNAIREKTGTTELLTLDEMPTAIAGIETGGGGGADLPEEAFVITGDCQYRFSENGWNWFIENYGDKITTKDITHGSYMFSYSDKLTNIPFDINCKEGTMIDCSSMFKGCKDLTSIPIFNNCLISKMNDIFEDCRNIRYLPDNFADGFDFSYVDGLTSLYDGEMDSMFYCCSGLRALPMDLLAHGNPVINYSYSIYSHMAYGCHILDEIVDLPNPHYNATWTSDAFRNAFRQCGRLKNMTFKLQDDGTPYIVNWKSQTIDLVGESLDYCHIGYVTKYIGNASSSASIYVWYLDNWQQKVVYDDISYQALKDDPDWWADRVEYSRYNHDSAVATINSLPDTSAYLATAGGTNTIKFKGASGSATDGGAINTLTEEEIAVATAKGWTVTLT